MSDLIIKKNGTDYKLPMLAEHYPADRVYLDGDTSKTVQDSIDEIDETVDNMNFIAMTGITAGTGISDVGMTKASIGGRTLLRGSFRVTSARASGDTIMSGLGILGGGVGVAASPYSSGGIATYLNGTLLSNSTLAASANPYYVFVMV